MKRSVFIYLCGLLAFITFYACNTSDSDLQKNVESVMVAYPGVSTSVNNGVATLTGTVASEDMRQGAERAAKAVKNIKSVNNNIVVNAPSNNLNLPVPNDGATVESITRTLSNEGYNDVRVSMMDGEVTLTGKVKRADLQRVMQIANESGARRVINNIEIE